MFKAKVTLLSQFFDNYRQKKCIRLPHICIICHKFLLNSKFFGLCCKIADEKIPANRKAKKLRLFSKKGSIGKKLIIINT